MKTTKEINGLIKENNKIIKNSLNKIKEDILSEMDKHIHRCYWATDNAYGDCRLTTKDNVILKIILETNQVCYFIFNDEFFEETEGYNNTLTFKEPPTFDLLKFQKELANEFNKLETITDADNDNQICVLYHGNVVVDKYGNVNYMWWNSGCLKGHPIFKFDNNESVNVDNFEKAEEFKKVLRIYFKYTKLMQEELYG